MKPSADPRSSASNWKLSFFWVSLFWGPQKPQQKSPEQTGAILRRAIAANRNPGVPILESY